MADSYFFFFQAEDGIRDVAVTGVQTCALPISSRMLRINKPAPTRATRDSAISETTSRLRSLFRPQPIDPPRTPILRVSAKSGTEARKAGARPNKIGRAHV